MQLCNHQDDISTMINLKIFNENTGKGRNQIMLNPSKKFEVRGDAQLLDSSKEKIEKLLNDPLLSDLLIKMEIMDLCFFKKFAHHKNAPSAFGLSVSEKITLHIDIEGTSDEIKFYLEENKNLIQHINKIIGTYHINLELSVVDEREENIIQTLAQDEDLLMYLQLKGITKIEFVEPSIQSGPNFYFEKNTLTLSFRDGLEQLQKEFSMRETFQQTLRNLLCNKIENISGIKIEGGSETKQDIKNEIDLLNKISADAETLSALKLLSSANRSILLYSKAELAVSGLSGQDILEIATEMYGSSLLINIENSFEKIKQLIKSAASAD